ncbi:HlyD family secretion protein [Entomohabitans teleogrylli]|uniref:HlyD family secretion protein n=1 Tax=Entomohabitans teleogrylli TaxID=1384589 RepID=UPI0008FC5D7C|nr:biotin/lipoyl-binding protein [Entomohabitans teleogrylli]
MELKQHKTLKPAVKTAMTFVALFLTGVCLIGFGSRNDAVTVAQSLKSGVLTADEVNVAFENVAGKVIRRGVEESQMVRKGEVLMVLDDVDTRIAIERLQATIRYQQALIRHEEAAMRIAHDENRLAELSAWRKIEEIQAALNAARASEGLARVELNRVARLIKSNSVSQSELDTSRNSLTQAQSAVVQTERQLASATIGATGAQLQALAGSGKAQGMSLQTISNTRETIENRANTLEQLRAQLAQYQADLRQLEVDLARLTLTAPESGKILKLLYEAGEMVPPGAPAVLLETDRKYVDIYVNENMVTAYPPGAQVQARVPALGEGIQGTVRFATAASSFSDLRMTRERGQADLTSYQVRIYTHENPRLLTGMTVEVDDAQQR